MEIYPKPPSITPPSQPFPGDVYPFNALLAVTPQKYGAIANGKNFCDTAIAQAVADCSSIGGNLHFPAGTYAITQEILISLAVGGGGMKVTGDGKNASIIFPLTPNQHVFHVQSYEPIIFRDLSLYTNITKTAGAGIYIEGPASDNTKANLNSLIDNVSISNQWRGVWFTEAAYWTIDHSRIGESLDTGVYIQNTVNVDEGDSQINNTVIVQKDSNSVNGIYYESSGGLKCNDLKILGFQYGFVLNTVVGESTADLNISNSSIENSTQRCIQLKGAGTFTNVSLTGSEFYNAAILVEIVNANVKNFTIDGNVFQIGATGTALQVTDAGGGTVTGNNFNGNGSASSAIAFGGNAKVTFDKSNVFNNVSSLMYNNAVGCQVEIYNTTNPANGNWQVGDRWVNTAPSVLGTAGSQYIIEGGVCTASGSPGTWTPRRSLTGS